MKLRSKRYRNNLKKLNTKKYHNLYEVLRIVKETATSKFIESIELHIKLNQELRDIQQQFKSTVILPHKVNRFLSIAVLTTEDNFNKAIDADIIGNKTLITNILQNNIFFDTLIATPNMMPKLAQLGKILGPKRLMPSLKSGTITNNLKDTILEFKKGKFTYKADKTGVIHVKIGKSDFTEKQLIENLQTLYKSLEENCLDNNKNKNTFINSIFICTTMGPSIKLDLNFLK